MRPIAPLSMIALLLACGGSPDPEVDTDRRGPPGLGTSGGEDPAETSLVEVDADGAQIDLLDAGQPPRRVLRYAFDAMGRARMKVSMDMGFVLTMSGQTVPPTPIPTTDMRFEVVPREVTGEGHLVYDFEIVGIDVASGAGHDPAVVQAMREQLAPMQGMTGWARVTPRGLIVESDFAVPPDAGLQLERSLENLRTVVRQLTAVLPEEPVGSGARWRVRTPIETPELRMSQTADFALSELGESGARLELGIQQSAPRQVMPSPQPGVEPTLESLTGAGSGTMDVRFDELVPRLDLSLHTEVEASFAGDGRPMRMHLGTDVHTIVEPSQPLP